MRLTAAFLVAALGFGLPVQASGSDAQAARKPLKVAFALMAGDAPASCGSPLRALGRDGTTASLRDVRVYLQDPALVDVAGKRVPIALDGNDWQNGRVVLIDFTQDDGTCVSTGLGGNRTITGTVPAGEYAGLAFTIGVPEEMNHTSTELEAPPLDLAAMNWSWQAGRKFVNIEIDPEAGIARDDGTRATTWFVHLGSTGCTGNPMGAESVTCLYPNRVPVQLDRFDAERDVVAFDLAALVRESRLGQDRGAAAGCMSGRDDPECAEIFPLLGLSVETGEPGAEIGQRVFRAQPAR